MLKIRNLHASNVADGINVTLPRALDGALNAIILSELPFLDVEAIVAEIVFSKLSASFRVSLTYTFNMTRISFFARCINTEESVDLDSVSDFEDRDES